MVSNSVNAWLSDPSLFSRCLARTVESWSSADTPQSLPLQQAFLEGMEPLLAVQTTVDPRTRQYSERIQREAAQTRRSHPSTSAEKEEEQRWESGVGLGGAFGNRVKQGNTKGIERSAWEWRGEDAVLKATAAMETAREQAKEAAGEAARNSQTKAEGNVAVKEMPAAEEAFPTPLTEVLKPADAISHRLSAASLPSKSVDASSEKSTLYRFVDTSTRGIVQPKDVQKAIQDREKSMAKRAKRRAARV